MTNEPTIRRKFQLTDLSGNSNKWWLVEWWEDTNRMLTSYGRVGNAAQTTEKFVSRYGVEQKVQEKKAKGYVEVELHVPPVVTQAAPRQTTVIEPKVQQLIDLVYREAGEKIATYLAVGIDALSQNQIKRGREILQQIISNKQHGNYGFIAADVEAFYNTIPTQLPRKIDRLDVARDFILNLDEHEDRLNQLEAGLAVYTAQGAAPQMNLLSALGDVEIKLLPETSPAYDTIQDYVLRTAGGRYNVHGIFAVKIGPERAAWEAETRGKHNITSLFHGTRTHNVRHILRSGLIIPRAAANGSRFGRGIYFADRSKRSLNYTGSRSSNLKVLFVADVALGTPKQMPGEDSRITDAPAGFDSVQGVKSYSGLDEFIVYRPSQQTIRAIVTVE